MKAKRTVNGRFLVVTVLEVILKGKKSTKVVANVENRRENTV